MLKLTAFAIVIILFYHILINENIVVMETCWLLGFTCYQVYHSLVPLFLCANS